MERKILILKVPDEACGARIDSFLSSALDGFTRNSIQRLCDDGRIFLSGKPAAKNCRLRAGDEIEVCIPPAREYEIIAQDIPLNIVYEDGYLLVVDKPRGMVVHPAPGNEDGTLVNALLHHCGGSLSGINGVMRPGIVHRIDKDTSGLLVVAKNDTAHQSLAAQIHSRSLLRRYDAIVYGRVRESGTVALPIARHPVHRKRMCVMEGGREALTHYEIIRELKGFTHLGIRLETGRTHQIRVHMAAVGHPVAGDPIYGPAKVISSLNGQCLHASRIGFVHPISGEQMDFLTGLPGYFMDFAAKHRL
ncbi:MAG: RluA family pseudouridine synthase [Oscillospiraceae bacterium]|nr:RluA family pseudouridine synthase [Oscillospiraceae bacterium]